MWSHSHKIKVIQIVTLRSTSFVYLVPKPHFSHNAVWKPAPQKSEAGGYGTGSIG